MDQTVYVQFNDKAIRQALRGGGVLYLRDEHFPVLRLRSHLGGESGAWEVRHLSRWRKAGLWPQTGALDILAELSGVLASLSVGCEPDRCVGVLRTVGDLLDWYAQRQGGMPHLAANTKRRRRSNVRVWLVRLRSLTLVGLTLEHVDRVLIQPMKEVERKPATIRQVFQTLRAALHMAVRLRLLPVDPLAGVKVTDFDIGPVRARQGRLHPQDVGRLVDHIAKCWPRHWAAAMLSLLMLAHGTRVGETRQAQWADFDLDAGWWVLPAATTKMGRVHELPLTPEMVAILRFYWTHQSRGGSAYLFPGRGGGPLGDAQASNLVRLVSGGEWSSHDLRKLARGCWELLGVDSAVSERLLSHHSGPVEGAYLQIDWRGLKREALVHWHGVGNARVSGLGLKGVLLGWKRATSD